ncbi:sugar-binding protein [Flavitalea sp.]|nr:sugar-binding protein [Flavitalea sp.]
MIWMHLVICIIAGLYKPDNPDAPGIPDARGTRTLFSEYAPTKISIDGDLKEWSKCASTTIIDSFRRKSNNKMSFQSMWNKNFLYLAFIVEDVNLAALQSSPDHPELYLDDMVEFLIDTRNRKDSCWDTDDIIYHINLLGQKKDDRGTIDCRTDPNWNGNAVYALTIRGSLNDNTDKDTGYSVEIAISWKELGVEPASGKKLGFNFANGDNGKLFDWVNASPFRSPYRFGDLELIKE